MRERIDDRVRGQLATSQGGVDPLTGERIEEVGGISDEQRAGMPRSPRMRGEWPGRGRRFHAPRTGEAGAQMCPGRQPSIEKPRAVVRYLRGPRGREDRGHGRDVVADVRDPDEAIAFD